jgi:hypothetical protein
MRKVLGTATGVVLATIAVVLIVFGVVFGVAEVVIAGDDDEFADWFMAIVAAATILAGGITARLALALLRRT